MYEEIYKDFIAYDEVMFDAFHKKEPFEMFYNHHSHGLSLDYVLAKQTLPYDYSCAYAIHAMCSNKHYAHLILQDYYFYRMFCNEYKETQQTILANIHEICNNDFAMTIGERVFVDEYVVSIVSYFL